MVPIPPCLISKELEGWITIHPLMQHRWCSSPFLPPPTHICGWRAGGWRFLRSKAVWGICEQVNGPLTPHKSLAWLIRQWSDSPPLRFTPARQLPIPDRWYQCKAKSRGKSKAGFRGLRTKKAQQFSPAVQMTHVQASCSLWSSTPGGSAKENTLHWTPAQQDVVVVTSKYVAWAVT